MKNGIEIQFAYAEFLLLLRMALREKADENGSFKMVEEADDCGELLEKLLEKNNPPDIAIIGISDDENIFTIIKDILFMKMKWPAMGILIFTVPLHSYLINQLIKSGANGILNTRNEIFDDLFEVMNNIKANGYHYGSLAIQEQFEAVHEKKIDVAPLTKKQINLIRYCCEGKNYKEIAADLNVGYMAVYMAYKRLRKKLNIHERFGLAQFGFHARLVADRSYEEFRAKMDFLNDL